MVKRSRALAALQEVRGSNPALGSDNLIIYFAALIVIRELPLRPRYQVDQSRADRTIKWICA